ncbi:hypothetical protein [Thioclava atlantica]|uniref:Uncharacterized protein n=1 Tax=Thioclava atlantica TaxID=1317124 RepID=A0A085TSC1_9RHOB|nr:hypothetical protein [Thioclava atlantica]KFE33618.1 hypothetical protein DW2_17410 [Thioclava atlantica]
MKRHLAIAALVAAPVLVPAISHAQSMDAHDMMSGDHAMTHSADMAEHAGMMTAGSPEGETGAITEPGQSAFAAIQEIVAHLLADPETDWSRVDIEALRQHLIDMNNVTLHAQVSESDIPGGARFEAISEAPEVTASIRAMVPAHVATMNGVEGWKMSAEEIPGGSALTVTGADAQKIRALGFIGILTVGAHHQAHHLAIAKGEAMHGH